MREREEGVKVDSRSQASGKSTVKMLLTNIWNMGRGGDLGGKTEDSKLSFRHKRFELSVGRIQQWRHVSSSEAVYVGRPLNRSQDNCVLFSHVNTNDLLFDFG